MRAHRRRYSRQDGQPKGETERLEKISEGLGDLTLPGDMADQLLKTKKNS